MLKAMKNRLDPQTNAVDLLKADHREVETLFEAFEKSETNQQKRAVVTRICTALEAHTKIEEKIFYPAVKEVLTDETDLVNEAIVEHAGAKKLIRELKDLPAADEFFDPKVKVLMEYIKHHVKEEESEMFPKVEDSDVDLVALAADMQALKERTLKTAA